MISINAEEKLVKLSNHSQLVVVYGKSAASCCSLTLEHRFLTGGTRTSRGTPSVAKGYALLCNEHV